MLEDLEAEQRPGSGVIHAVPSADWPISRWRQSGALYHVP